MEPPRQANITTRDGQRGLADLPQTAKEGDDVLVRLENGRQVLVPYDVLVAQPDGGYYLPVDVRGFETRQEAGAEDDVVVIPIAEEHLEVQKRQVRSGGVRVTKTVEEREEQVDEAGFREEVDVERVPINEIIDEPVAPRVEGDTLIVPLLEEVLVVEKRLVLKEEVRITRRRIDMPRQETVTLRREEAHIERIPGEARPERDTGTV